MRTKGHRGLYGKMAARDISIWPNCDSRNIETIETAMAATRSEKKKIETLLPEIDRNNELLHKTIINK